MTSQSSTPQRGSSHGDGAGYARGIAGYDAEALLAAARVEVAEGIERRLGDARGFAPLEDRGQAPRRVQAAVLAPDLVRGGVDHDVGVLEHLLHSARHLEADRLELGGLAAAGDEQRVPLVGRAAGFEAGSGLRDAGEDHVRLLRDGVGDPLPDRPEAVDGDPYLARPTHEPWERTRE